MQFFDTVPQYFGFATSYFIQVHSIIIFIYCFCSLDTAIVINYINSNILNNRLFSILGNGTVSLYGTLIQYTEV